MLSSPGLCEAGRQIPDRPLISMESAVGDAQKAESISARVGLTDKTIETNQRL